jgi:hypothetical protein
MSVTDNTIELLKLAQATPDELLKAFVQPAGGPTTGFQTYNLAPAVLEFTPVLTPLRNSIARDVGGFATQANWKAVTNINTGNMRIGVAEGQRGGIVGMTQLEYMAAFRGFGMENNVSFEATYAAKNFDDLRARAVRQLLSATMIQEERLILGGNTSVALGITPTPTVTTSGTGGTIAAGTQSVICVALALQAYLDVVGANNGATGQLFAAATTLVPGQISRTGATPVGVSGSVATFGGGSAQQSPHATVVTTGSASTVSAVVAAVNGAVGYAWFMGAVGSEKLVAVSSINSVVLTAAAVGGAQLASAIPNAAADNSTSTLDYDGLLYQAFKPGSNAQIVVQPSGTAGTGTGLTSDNSGGVYEFEAMFVNFYNRYRLSPTIIYVAPQELVNLARKVIAGNGSPLLALTSPIDAVTRITAGVTVGSYFNKVTGTTIPIVVHPNMPAGTVFFYTDALPYALSNVDQVCRVLLRQDYYQIEWPITGRRYDYGVYFDGVLQHFAPFSMGVMTNIGNA